MSSNLPPGVSGSEAALHGEVDYDPHAPYYVEADVAPPPYVDHGRWWAVMRSMPSGEASLLTTFSVRGIAELAAAQLNEAVAACSYTDRETSLVGTDCCAICGEPSPAYWREQEAAAAAADAEARS